MISLGLHVGHDAGAAIIKDGDVLMVAEAERVLDLKHVRGAGAAKIAALQLMKTLAVAPGEIDAVFIGDEHPDQLDRAPAVSKNLHAAPFVFPLGEIGRPEHIDHALGELELRTATPVYLVCHSMAHAAGALYMRGAANGAALVYDGYGTCCGTMAYSYKAGRLSRLEPWRDRFLVGLRYSAFGYYISQIQKDPATVSEGFLDWAGKIMGLHAYGRADDELVRGFMRHFQRTNYQEYASVLHADIDQYEDFIASGGDHVRRGLFPDCLSVDNPDHLVIVASMQEAFSRITCSAAAELLTEVGTDLLMVSGGCGLNIVTNERLAALPEVGELFVPPNCDDRGIALGAAVIGDSFLTGAPLHHPDVAPARRRSPYKGLPVLNDVPSSQWGVDITSFPRSAENAARVAERIAAGGIVGFIQGQNCEIGPRALGNRSILASAADPDMRDKINRKIKSREWWRPFAPVCRGVDADTYFELSQPDPYMLIGGAVRPEFRDRLPAITHVDGTARVQTLAAREDHPLLWDILTATKEQTGIGVLLNTSFNAGGKPLANRTSAVIDLLKTTEIDGVWIGDLWITRPGA